MDKVHEIKIRSNHLLLTLHKILILVLKYSISLHDACKNKGDLNIGLAEVIAANIQNFFKKKSIQKNAHYKKYFYDGKGQLKNSIEIEKLDISILVILTRTKFIASPPTSTNPLFLHRKCCIGCKHDKCFCGDMVDQEFSCMKKANCGYEACASNCPIPQTWKCSIDCKHQHGCLTGTNAASSPQCLDPKNCKKMGCPCPSSTKCDYIIMKRYIDVAAFFRNCISHVTYNECCNLEAGIPAFDEFPLSKSWREVWEVVNKASLDCLKVLSNNIFIQKDDLYKDYEMRLRISLKEDIRHLLDIVSNDIQNCFQVILGEERNSEQLKDYKYELDNLRKSMDILLTLSFFISCETPT